MRTTINTVTKNLPPKVRDAIRALWVTGNSMDLNYGNLETYIAVINQTYAQTKQQLEIANRKLADIASLAKQKD